MSHGISANSGPHPHSNTVICHLCRHGNTADVPITAGLPQIPVTLQFFQLKPS